MPLIISDVMFAQDGALLWDDDDHDSLFGDVILVNGRPWPTMAVEQRNYRFRVLNASLSRGYRLRLSNGQPFAVIATDGGLVSAPIMVPELLDRHGRAVRDRSRLHQPPGRHEDPADQPGRREHRDYDDTGKVMQFQVSGPATDPTQQHPCPRRCSAPRIR